MFLSDDDLEYFRNEMIRLYETKELTEDELIDLRGSERLRREGREVGKAEEIIEMGQEFGLDDAAILKKLQEKIGLSIETATAYLEKYDKQLV